MKNGDKMEEEKIAAIANLCLKKYKESGKQGKPREGQWTVLAGVVMEFENKLELISLATGTKCLSGAERINAKLPGALLNDSHAEVLARRGLIYWLQSEVLRCLDNKDESSYLNFSYQGKISLKPGLKLHMYSSYPPCGDATIFPIKSQQRSNEDPGLPIQVNEDSKDNNEDDSENVEPPSKKLKQSSEIDVDRTGAKYVEGVDDDDPPAKKHKQSSDIDMNRTGAKYVEGVDDDPPAKKHKQISDIDINRTGAKCVEGCEEDPRGEGVDYHSVRQIRTKPGRGDRTLSLSCSDKILKWNILGILGSHLCYILEDPVYLTSIIIGSSSYNLESCNRAFNTRYKSLQTHSIQVYNYTETEFEDQKSVDKVPSPDSSLLVTGEGHQGLRETYVAGLRQGWSKKKVDNPKSWSSVSQRKLALRTLDIMERIRLINTTIEKCDAKISCDKDHKMNPTTYLSLKSLSKDYNESKRKFKGEMKTWPIKSDSLYEFNINGS